MIKNLILNGFSKANVVFEERYINSEPKPGFPALIEAPAVSIAPAPAPMVPEAPKEEGKDQAKVAIQAAQQELGELREDIRKPVLEGLKSEISETLRKFGLQNAFQAVNPIFDALTKDLEEIPKNDQEKTALINKIIETLTNRIQNLNQKADEVKAKYEPTKILTTDTILTRFYLFQYQTPEKFGEFLTKDINLVAAEMESFAVQYKPEAYKEEDKKLAEKGKETDMKGIVASLKKIEDDPNTPEFTKGILKFIRTILEAFAGFSGIFKAFDKFTQGREVGAMIDLFDGDSETGDIIKFPADFTDKLNSDEKNQKNMAKLTSLIKKEQGADFNAKLTNYWTRKQQELRVNDSNILKTLNNKNGNYEEFSEYFYQVMLNTQQIQPAVQPASVPQTAPATPPPTVQPTAAPQTSPSAQPQSTPAPSPAPQPQPTPATPAQAAQPAAPDQAP